MNKILVTGATGFVGRHLCELLSKQGLTVVGAVRSLPTGKERPAYEFRAVGDIAESVDWDPVLEGVDGVVHLAARVHVMHEQESDPLAAFRRVNVEGTEKLLRSANMRGVKRVVYISSIKVHGDATTDSPFIVTDVPAPSDPYAQSKLEAEHKLEAIGADVGVETVVIRPPLVYGPGVGGNFLRMMQIVDRRIPLPLASVNNRRSLVCVDNLCDLVRECLGNPAASGKRFLVSDNADVSTPDLIRLIAASMSRPARLFPVPVRLLEFAAKLAGRSAEVSRLIGSLQLDVSATTQALGWQPPVSLADGIDATVKWYEAQKANA